MGGFEGRKVGGRVGERESDADCIIVLSGPVKHRQQRDYDWRTATQPHISGGFSFVGLE